MLNQLTTNTVNIQDLVLPEPELTNGPCIAYNEAISFDWAEAMTAYERHLDEFRFSTLDLKPIARLTLLQQWSGKPVKVLANCKQRTQSVLVRKVGDAKPVPLHFAQNAAYAALMCPSARDGIDRSEERWQWLLEDYNRRLLLFTNSMVGNPLDILKMAAYMRILWPHRWLEISRSDDVFQNFQALLREYRADDRRESILRIAPWVRLVWPERYDELELEEADWHAFTEKMDIGHYKPAFSTALLAAKSVHVDEQGISVTPPTSQAEAVAPLPATRHFAHSLLKHA